ncbi:MAG: hypothetical protein ACYTBJ_23480, partial [Planctomycetota bacterium]
VHIDNIGLRYVLGADSDSNGYMESHDFAVLASRWLRCAGSFQPERPRNVLRSSKMTRPRLVIQ